MKNESSLQFVASLAQAAAHAATVLASRSPLAQQLGRLLISDLIAIRHAEPMSELDEARGQIKQKIQESLSAQTDLMKTEGEKLWEIWHRRAMARDAGHLVTSEQEELAWIKTFIDDLPCEICRAHSRRLLRKLPPDLRDYFFYTVDFHNAVNHLRKVAEISHEEAFRRWS